MASCCPCVNSCKCRTHLTRQTSNCSNLGAIVLKEIAFLVNIRNNRSYEVVPQEPVTPVGRDLLAAPKEGLRSCRCSDLLQVVVARVS